MHDILGFAARSLGHRGRLLGRFKFLPFCVVMIVGGGCGSSASSTVIDLTVKVDSALSLDAVDIAIRAAGKPDDHLSRTPASTILVNIFTKGLANGTAVSLEVGGIKAGSTIVLARAQVVLIAGHRIPVTVELTAACQGILSCDINQTCVNGICVSISTPNDGGATDAGGTAGVGAIDAAQQDVAGSGGIVGIVGSGGAGQTGGASGTGGGIVVGTGGTVGTGGVSPMGGAGGFGGTIGTGARGGSSGTGGRAGSGGAVATGGSGTGGSGTGGRVGTGGTGTGGTGTGGTKAATGSACTNGSECLSAACVDSVCCETTCPGLCMACSATKTGASNGLCRPVRAGTDLDGDCALDATNPCGLDGTCDGVGACRFQVTGTTCGASSCVDGMASSTFTGAGRCNGSGTCISATTSAPCPSNLGCASSTACSTACTERSTTGCAFGFKCLSGTCIAATVQCGDVVACPVASGGGLCCATAGATQGAGSTVFTCQPAGATCNSLSTIPCNSRTECPANQICCVHLVGGSTTVEAWQVGCVDQATGCGSEPNVAVAQVCDPSFAAPTECLVGTCHPSIPNDPSQVIPNSGLSICF